MQQYFIKKQQFPTYPQDVLNLLDEIKNKSLPQSLKGLRKLNQIQFNALKQRIDESISVLHKYSTITLKQNVYAILELKKDFLKHNLTTQDTNLMQFRKALQKESLQSLDKFFKGQREKIHQMIKRINDYVEKIQLSEYQIA